MALNHPSDVSGEVLNGEAANTIVKPAHQFLVSTFGLDKLAFRCVKELDQKVYRIDFLHRPSWIVRQFPFEERDQVAKRMADLLNFLETNNFPAERLVPEVAVLLHEGSGLIATQFLDGDRSICRKQDMIRFGYLLGKLQSLPYRETPFQRKGGAWHHISQIGGPKEELEAAKAAIQSLPGADERACKEVCAILDSLDCFQSLPETLIHADFVPSNAIIADGDKFAIIDWAGAGVGPRVWSLGFLLFAGASRNIKLVDCVLGGYRCWDTLEPSELDALGSAVLARPLVIDCWEAIYRAKKVSEILQAHSQRIELANGIVERARAIFAVDK